MTAISFEDLRHTAKNVCDYYSTTCDGNLIWCKHPDNKCQTEGNCHPDDCPILNHIKELNEAQKPIMHIVHITTVRGYRRDLVPTSGLSNYIVLVLLLGGSIDLII